MNPVLESSFNKNQWVLLLTVALVFGGVVLQVESPFVVHAQAEATYTKLLDEDPLARPVLMDRAQMLLQLGRWSEALGDLG